MNKTSQGEKFIKLSYASDGLSNIKIKNYSLFLKVEIIGNTGKWFQQTDGGKILILMDSIKNGGRGI